jgi:hypothetical protein
MVALANTVFTRSLGARTGTRLGDTVIPSPGIIDLLVDEEEEGAFGAEGIFGRYCWASTFFGRRL